MVASVDVSIESTGVPAGQGERFAREIGTVVGWITNEMGPVTATVCLVGADEDTAFDRDQVQTQSRLFHARMEADRALLVISTPEQIGRVSAAAAFGLSHIKLWQESGGEGWPEPLATAIAFWYRTRLLDHLELRHAEARAENFFDNESRVDWVASRQVAVLVWNPETHGTQRQTGFQSGLVAVTPGASGDIIAFATAAEGLDILLDRDRERWAERERSWRVSLRVELTGRETPTTVWVGGIGIAVGVVLLATVVAVGGIVSKRRRRRHRTQTPPPVPGLFTEEDQPPVQSG